ncbi:hypothetical protein BDR26DRAFT_920450 [Obelidium mucronatum]|nr:hypothetical protein BDR26DRAFT_920450 [Obelidium mucronatum]
MAMAQADVGKYEQKYINLLEDRLNASEKLKAQVEKSSNLSKTIDAMIQEVLALREVCFNRKISTENISSSFSAIESRAVKDLTVKEFVSEPIQQNDLVVQPRQSRQRQKQLQEQPQPQQPATISHAQTNIRHADEARETSQKKSRETRSAKKPAPAQPQPQQPITQKPSIVIRTHPIQSPNILHQCDCCTTASSSLWFEGPSACVLCANCAELMKQGKILYTPLPPDDSAQV